MHCCVQLIEFLFDEACVDAKHLQPHDLPIGLCVTASATTPVSVAVLEQLQLLAPH
jgi:hypothetical protein